MIPKSQVISPQMVSRNRFAGGQRAQLYSVGEEAVNTKIDDGLVVGGSIAADGVDPGSPDTAIRADEVRRL